MPTIRVDDDVYGWLQENGSTFEDTPNSVLRRIAGLDISNNSGERLSGRILNQRWQVGAVHALYHKDGTFYEQLQSFPGALFDKDGFVFFKDQASYEYHPGLRHGQKLNVPGGIASLREYIRKRQPR